MTSWCRVGPFRSLAGLTLTALLVASGTLAVGGCTSSGRQRPTTAEEALASNPLYPLSVQREGSVYYQQGKYHEALRKFEEARQLQPSNATVYNLIGSCHRQLGNYPEALEAFNMALELAPAFSDARNNRGATYMDLKEYRLAEVEFVAVLADHSYPHRWQVYYNLGMSYFFRDDYASAEEAFRRAAFSPRPLAAAFLALAEIEQRRGNIDEALSYLEQARIKFPQTPLPTYRLAELLYNLGRVDEARPLFEEVIADFPSSTAARQARRMLQPN